MMVTADVLNNLGCYASGNDRHKDDDAFFVADLGDITKKYKLWKKELPRVKPYYAVKCNDNRTVLSTLKKLGVGFDCASKAEIQQVLKLRVSPSRIIYANPCKQSSHIKYAAKNNVNITTFDNVEELYKIKAICPDTRLLLRLLPPVSDKAACELGMKFGCDPKLAPHLLSQAQELGLNVVGISFHVGSGCYDANAFVEAVKSARSIFDVAQDMGFDFKVLDIGGGFPGDNKAKLSFQEICSVLRPTLDELFPASSGISLIAEPGRFFVASAFKLVVNIIAKRAIPSESGDDSHNMYYVNDGVYGSFNCLLYDHAEVHPELLPNSKNADDKKYTSSVWGPTCDGLDCIMQTCQLPELDIGDWLLFSDMGAYTLAAASSFNGMPKPDVFFTSNLLENTGKRSCAMTNIPRMRTGLSINEEVPPIDTSLAAVAPSLQGY